jgi:predicted phage gp36 major capsid-like protein
MATISVAQATETNEADLWGEIFKIKPQTKAVLEAADKAQEEYLKAVEKAETSDDVVRAIALLLDVRLEPPQGKRVKASTVVLKKWDANELTLPELRAFSERVAEVADGAPPQ